MYVVRKQENWSKNTYVKMSGKSWVFSKFEDGQVILEQKMQKSESFIQNKKFRRYFCEIHNRQPN